MTGKFGSVANKSVEWYTPDWIFHKLAIDFDLDPASPVDFETPVPAATKFTVIDNGLDKDWFGKVWMNPPYSRETTKWMSKFIAHRNGVCLVFSRTDAKWFQSALASADAIILMSGRINFIPGVENKHKKSRAGAGTAMFAFGDECKKALSNLKSHGFLICR